MGTLQVETPYPNTPKQEEAKEEDSDDVSPIEEVRLTVTNSDDPTLPVWTFRMWFLGLLSCGLLSFINQFFAYRTEPLVVTQITVQVATLPIGHFLAAILPGRGFRVPGFGSRRFSLNPGPFNMKEHVLISIFANAGSAFGNGSAYAVGIVTIVKAFYGRNISFLAGIGIWLGRALEKVCDRTGPYVVAWHPGSSFPLQGLARKR
ncbi:oligopeptide transporter [Striga asiatica]|uniref:Oligopeptide transporter n=1 Tax=Striga asiatica TaxID=4170 RepID=A0A5A7QAU7_STRAF|nr:oligopeptide transporter [Striga asiatica]